jgi:hypothetical protein
MQQAPQCLSLQLIGIKKIRQGHDSDTVIDQGLTLLGGRGSTNRTLLGLAFVNAAGFFGETRTDIFSIADEFTHLLHDGSLDLSQLESFGRRGHDSFT